MTKNTDDKDILNKFLHFLFWCGTKENHGNLYPTLAKNDWYGIKYGHCGLQSLPITDFKDLDVDDIIKRFIIWIKRREQKNVIL
jgi:hypothetical protein